MCLVVNYTFPLSQKVLLNDAMILLKGNNQVPRKVAHNSDLEKILLHRHSKNTGVQFWPSFLNKCLMRGKKLSHITSGIVPNRG